jgi:hypothetical protein
MRLRALQSLTTLLALIALLWVIAAAPSHSHGKIACSVCAAADHTIEEAAHTVAHASLPQAVERTAPVHIADHRSEPPYATVAPRAPPL